MEIKEPHGRETFVAYFGDLYVMKRPLPGHDKDAWLKKQHKTKDDLRLNAQSEKTNQNNIEKVFFMRELIGALQYIEKQLSK